MPIMELYLVFFCMILIGSSGLILQLLFRHKAKERPLKSETTLKFFRLLIPLAMIIAFGFYLSTLGSYKQSWEAQALGLVLYFIGMGLRWYAVWRLKQLFTVQLAIQDNHRLITSGLFKHIRHPSYLGMLTYFLGLGLIMHNYLSLLVLLGLALKAIVNRINAEEKLLSQHFGNSYLQYQKTSSRLIPFLY